MDEKKDKEKDTVPPITEQVKEYLETYIQLARYRAIERGTSIVAGVVTDVLIVLGLALTFLFVSFTVALYLGYLLNSYWQGFGLVTLFYLLIIIIIMIFKKNLERPIVNVLIKKLFK